MSKGTYNKHYAKKNKNIDCVVEFDPNKETLQDLSIKILEHLLIKRLGYNKPVILGVFGKSGEGKSESIASLIEELLKRQGVNFEENFDVMNAFTPLQYGEKLDKIMFDKKYKKIKAMIIHEAREVVKAKNWHSFINIAISDINAMARSVKRIMTVVISQGLRDIDKGMRSTLTHYAKIERPNNPDLNAKMFLRIIYEDDRQMERPILKRRKPKILVIYPDKRCRTLIPSYIEIPRASKKVREMLKRMDNEAKAPIIKKKLYDIQEEMKKEWGVDEGKNKLENFKSFYLSNKDRFNQVFITKGQRCLMRKEFKDFLKISGKEEREFRKEVIEIAKEKGYLESKKNLEEYKKEEEING